MAQYHDRAGEGAALSALGVEGRAGSRRHGPFSGLTRRILALNVLILVILAGGVLYMGQYRNSLIDAELDALRTQGEIFASALGEGAVVPAVGGYELDNVTAQQMLRRLVQPVRTRARLFSADGDLLADSRVLPGSGGSVQIERLAPPGGAEPLSGRIFGFFLHLIDWLPRRDDLPPYREAPVQRAVDYDEVVRALAGEPAVRARTDARTSSASAQSDGGLVLSAAVPVQRYKQVLGVLLLSRGGENVAQALHAVRLDILKVFAVTLAVTVLMSLFLAGTIVRPIHRLAEAAERVRLGRGKRHDIPDFTRRRDEVGDLSGALRDMTATLWARMDAIERFAADVAHEIKNPLTSLRSAVETAARIADPDQQRRLMAIIIEDVQRLDRLISDISNASRLDAELSRTETGPVDMGALLSTLAAVHGARRPATAPSVRLDLPDPRRLMVNGMEGQLALIFRNLIDNAISFSPPGGVIELRAIAENGAVRIVVEDEGPGIPPDNLETIFSRFYTERPEHEEFGAHSGLGLSIARQIVEAHGGTIAAENRIDGAGHIQGSRFIVHLPRGV